MPWTTSNYPVSMKNLDPKTRKKAIEIANALLEDGRDEGSAIAIATTQAERWSGGGEPAESHYHVVPHKRGWAVRRGRSTRASGIFSDKKTARERAQKLAQEKGVYLVINDANGKEVESIAPD